MSMPVVVAVEEPPTEPDETVEEVTEVIEAVADVVEEATGDSDAVDAVVVETELDLVQRVAVLETQMQNKADRSELESIRATAWGAQDDAIEALEVAEAAIVDADEATDPGEVEAMIEGTEIVEGEDGEEHLDAPSDVPPPGAQQHWMFADRKTLTQRIADKFNK